MHVPYRSSLLTRILAECFVRPNAALAVIGTVSPTPTDTEHTVSTLRAISVLGGSNGVHREEKEDVPAVSAAAAARLYVLVRVLTMQKGEH